MDCDSVQARASVAIKQSGKDTGRFSPLALTHLRSQDLFEVIVILHVCGLLFPGMAIVSQRHLLVVTV